MAPEPLTWARLVLAPVLLAQVTPHDVAQYVPALSPLLVGDTFWRLVVLIILIGVPHREETTRGGVTTTRWRWRGGLAMGWVWLNIRLTEAEAFSALVRRFWRLMLLLEAKLGGGPARGDSDPPSTVRQGRGPLASCSDERLEDG